MPEPFSTLLLPRAVSGSMNFWHRCRRVSHTVRPSVGQGPVGRSVRKFGPGPGKGWPRCQETRGQVSECPLWRCEIAAVPCLSARRPHGGNKRGVLPGAPSCLFPPSRPRPLPSAHARPRPAAPPPRTCCVAPGVAALGARARAQGGRPLGGGWVVPGLRGQGVGSACTARSLAWDFGIQRG